MEDQRKIEKSKSLLEKIGSFYISLSFKSYLTISFATSSFISYKYLKGQEIYEEFHGHYNSPKYYQNKNMRFFHLQEAIIRLCFGGLIIFSFLCLTKQVLISQKINAWEYKSIILKELNVSLLLRIF
jgi:hypothetical protein